MTFRVAALPGREFTGVVDFVDPVVQLPGRTITVKAVVPNPKRELQAGMFIDARLATAVRPNAVVVPEDAVLPLQGSNFVWVVKDGKATRRQVVLGVRTPGFVETKSGVEAGEQVVVGGQERLSEGAPVARQGGRADPCRRDGRGSVLEQAAFRRLPQAREPVKAVLQNLGLLWGGRRGDRRPELVHQAGHLAPAGLRNLDVDLLEDVGDLPADIHVAGNLPEVLGALFADGAQLAEPVLERSERPARGGPLS